MRHRRFAVVWLAAACSALLTLPQGIPAQPPANPPGNPPQHAGPPQDVVDDLLERGFRRIEPAVFQRPVEGNRSFETMAFGAEGLEFILRQYEAQLQILYEREQADPRPERLDAILALEGLVERTQATLLDLRHEEATAASRLWSNPDGLRSAVLATATCDTTLHRMVRASRGSLGPEAACEASYDDTCSDLGNAYCFAHAEGSVPPLFNEQTQTCDLPGVDSADCASSAAVEATEGCYSNAIAEVQFNTLMNGGSRQLVTLSLGETNNVCRSLAVSLTGTTSVLVPESSCRFASWTATASGGDGSYTYDWRYNGVLVKSGPSNLFSHTYFHPGYPGSFTDTVQVTVRDGTGETATAFRSVSVTYDASGGCGIECALESEVKSHAEAFWICLSPAGPSQ